MYVMDYWLLAFRGVSDFNYVNTFTSLFTKGVLATFTYLSGQLFANKEIKNWNDTFNFYKRRFIRIYPLFFVSVTLLYIMILGSQPQFEINYIVA